MESNEPSNLQTVGFWKDKCKECYQLCKEMKDENEYVTQRCKQLADMAVNLMQRV